MYGTLQDHILSTPGVYIYIYYIDVNHQNDVDNYFGLWISCPLLPRSLPGRARPDLREGAEEGVDHGRLTLAVPTSPNELRGPERCVYVCISIEPMYTQRLECSSFS